MVASRISALLLLLSALAAGLIAIDLSPPRPRPLTAEDARLALLDGIREGRIASGFGSKSSEEVADLVGTFPLEREHGDWCRIGVFQFNPTERRFAFSIGPRDPSIQACTFFYEGSFELADGKWIAKKPVVAMSALGGN